MKCYTNQGEIKAVSIPFIKSETPYETYSLYSMLSGRDCIRALILSFSLVFIIFKKYSKYDFLFRAYASYEFFLSCNF